MVELGDGRVAFADTKAKLFLAADLNTGKVDTLGTRVDSLIRNAPPEQYKFPGWVAQLGGDTVALVDFSALRTTLWGQDGKSRGVLPIRPVAGTAPVLVYDTVGHGYKVDYQAIIGGAEPGSKARPDSVPVLRIVLKTGKADTVANLASPEFGEATFGAQKQQAAKVFAPNDFFGVLPNGAAWLARGPREPGRLARTERAHGRAGSRTSTPGVPSPRPTATGCWLRCASKASSSACRRTWRSSIRSPTPSRRSISRSAGRTARSGCSGRARRRSAGDLRRVQPEGSWQRAVEFPMGASLAGFGAKGAVYASIKEADGARTVGRFTLR